MKHKLFGYVGEEIRSADVSTMLVQAGGAEVELDVFSKGGDLFEGYAIYSLLSNYSGTVTVTVYGIAASAGSLMIMGADTIKMTEGSWLMIHNASQGVYGDADEIEETGKRLKQIQKPMAEAYSKRSGLDVSKIEALMKVETWYDASSAVDAGFADEVIAVEEDEKAVAEFTAHDKRFYKNMPRSIQGFGQQQQQTEPKNKSDMKEIISALNKGSNSQLAKDSEESQVVARIESLKNELDTTKAQLATKTETLTTVNAKLETAENRLSELEKEQRENGIQSLIDKAVSEAGVSVSDNVREKLETRAKLHASIEDEGTQKEVYSDMVLYAKHNGVEVGSSTEVSGKGEPDRKIKTGEPEVTDSPEMEDSLSYEKKVDAKVDEIMKADKDISISDAVAQAKRELQNG